MVTFTTDPQNERYCVFLYIDRSEWHEFVSRFLCAVVEQRRTENTGMSFYYLFVLSQF